MQTFSSSVAARVLERKAMKLLSLAHKNKGIQTESEKSNGDHLWIHYRFDAMTPMNFFIHDLQTEGIGKGIENTGPYTCKVLI